MNESGPRLGPVRILDLDPDLGRNLSTSRLKAAEAALVARTIDVEAGAWDDARDLHGGRAPAGVLVIDGLVAQNVVLAGATAAELLGPGDFVHPFEVKAEHPFVNAQLGWDVLEPASLALLDDTFERALASYPEVAGALLARGAERTARLGLLRAAAHVGRVEDRLLALMWHLAARHGRIGRDGVILPLALRHRVLGDLVGASRSTVTLALGALERRGAVARRLEGGWVLLEPLSDAPPTKLRRSTTRSRAPRPAAATVSTAAETTVGRGFEDLDTLNARIAGLSAI